MGFLKPVLFIAFLAWLFFRISIVVRSLLILGLGIPVFNHAPGPCKVFHVNGSEDIDVLPGGLAIISSGLKYSLGPHDHDPAMASFEGRIYAFDFNDANQVLKEFTLKDFDSTDFVPHGIDTYIDPDTGEISLFVVNHGEGKESVELFQVDQENLVLNHKKTVQDENIYAPNDLVAVGPDSFYVTNDRFFNNGFLKQIEIFYPLKYGTVVFYNGTNARIVVGSMGMPNGINIDNTGRYIFVSEILEGRVVVFRRLVDNSLEKQQDIKLGTALDNIFVDEMGHLWSGAGNIAIIEYSKNFSNPCPARAYQLKLVRDDNDEMPFKLEDVVDVYSNKGDGDVKAASSAVFYKGKMLVGTVFGNLVYCDVVAA